MDIIIHYISNESLCQLLTIKGNKAITNVSLNALKSSETNKRFNSCFITAHWVLHIAL